MPLDRAHITVASRIMLPAYVVFFASQGVNYMIADETARASPALSFADDVMPLAAWGVVFLGCSALMVVSMIVKSRNLFRFALRICGLSIMFWAAAITAASLAGDATPLAATWPAFVATACYATDRSLGRREV